MNSLLHKIYYLMGKEDRRFLIFLVFYSLLISLVEIVGVAAIMPFISVATDFSIIESKRYFSIPYHFFGFHNQLNFVIAFGVVLIMFYIFRSILNGLYFYLLSRFSKGRYYRIAIKLYEKYLLRSYQDFIKYARSELQKVIVSESQNMMGVLSALLFMMSEIFIVLFIFIILIAINWKITMLITLFMLLNFFILIKFVSTKIKESGKGRESSEKGFYRHLNNTFGNMKMIKLSDMHKEFFEKFKNNVDLFVKYEIYYETLRQIPRLYLEAIGFIIVILIMLYFLIVNDGEVTSFLPIISVFILALYRLLPSFHRILNSYNQVLYHYRSVEVIYQQILYPPEVTGDEKITFRHKIECRDLGFSYTPDHRIIDGIDLVINRGEKIGIIGESGSGKSTLVDIIIGLFRPDEGAILIDDLPLTSTNVHNWRRKIGYIPQQIELIDGTVAQNVALSDHYDSQRVIEVLKQAHLYDYLTEHHEGIETEVGDNGIRLSGGQRQRIAIARALYREPELLVLDEATSALDMETERQIMEDIYALEGKTIVIVAHRLQTLYRCDRIFDITVKDYIKLD